MTNSRTAVERQSNHTVLTTARDIRQPRQVDVGSRQLYLCGHAFTASAAVADFFYRQERENTHHLRG